jgi:hypothetical protein
VNAPVSPSGWITPVSRSGERHVGPAWFLLGLIWIVLGVTLATVGSFLVMLFRAAINMDCGSTCGSDQFSPHFGPYTIALAIGMVVIGIGVAVRPGRLSGWASMIASLVMLGSNVVVLAVSPRASLTFVGLGVGATLVILSAVALRTIPPGPARPAPLSDADPG